MDSHPPNSSGPTPSTSRIPLAAGSRLSTTTTPSSSSTIGMPSLFSPLTRSTPSSLGKRGASEAGLDHELAVTRKELLATKSRLNTLERRLLGMQKTERESVERIEAQRVQIEQLTNERRILLDGETHEKEQGQQREHEWAEERRQFVKQINDLRRENAHLSSSLAEQTTLANSLTLQHATLSRNSKSEIAVLESQLRELQEERDSLKNWQHRAHSLSIELEESKRRLAEGVRSREEAIADQRTDEKVKDEFRRQSRNFREWTQAQATLVNELADLRRWKKEAEEAEHKAKETEIKLRDEIKVLNVQLERARRDVDSLTHTFSSPDSSSSSLGDLSTVQNRLSALSTLHTQVTEELAEKTRQVDSLHARLAALSTESQVLILDLTKRAEEAERELRWAKEGRRSAEIREELAKKELDAMLTKTKGTSSENAGDQSARVAQLEQLLETYKVQLESLSRDSQETEERIARGAGMVKMSELESAREQIDKLQRDVSSFEATIAQLTAANTTLDAEISDLMRRVASGEYNPSVERVIELKDNPAAKAKAIRMAMLEELRNENAALLDRLAKVDLNRSTSGSGSGGGLMEMESGGKMEALVPRESFDRLLKEKEEMEAAHAKRLLRLKEIFGLKSREFLEAVYSLLGWRIKFDESGADIRLSSMYAPKGKMGLTLKFASHEGHFGTMQMSGGMARGLEDARRFWVDERQSIPGFLAQVTTEMFEKTTIGRAAGYVGLE